MSRLDGMEACGWPPLLEESPEGPDEWHPDLDQDQDQWYDDPTGTDSLTPTTEEQTPW